MKMKKKNKDLSVHPVTQRQLIVSVHPQERHLCVQIRGRLCWLSERPLPCKVKMGRRGTGAREEAAGLNRETAVKRPSVANCLKGCVPTVFKLLKKCSVLR